MELGLQSQIVSRNNCGIWRETTTTMRCFDKKNIIITMMKRRGEEEGGGTHRCAYLPHLPPCQHAACRLPPRPLAKWWRRNAIKRAVAHVQVMCHRAMPLTHRQGWDRTKNYGLANQNQIQVLYLKEPQNVSKI